MHRPVFADPKTDFVFQRIFGSEDHKPVLPGFLSDLLELDDAHRIVSVSLLPAEQRPKVSELKYSIVDVKCIDSRGTNYIVEWDAYIAAGMAIQNERGALMMAHREGYEQGEEEGEKKGEKKGLLLGIEALCDAFGVELSAERRNELQALDAASLEALLAKLRTERRWP